jgi:hypothetical protein
MERFIDSGRETSLISTRSTRMPQGCSVGSSMTSLRWALTFSRSDGVGVVLHVDDRLDRVDDPVVDHRVHAQGDVVAGDGLLAGHGRHNDLHVDLGEPACERVDPGQPCFADAGQRPPEAEDDAFLVLRDDLEAEHLGRPIPRRAGHRACLAPRTALA